MNYQDVRIGDCLILDGDTAVVVTRMSVYINASQTRETGVSVRPVAGGRARPVSVSRLSVCPYCAPDELCALHNPGRDH